MSILIETTIAENTKAVSAVETIFVLLSEKDLTCRMKFPPKMLGVHPANRNGLGGIASEVHALGEQIAGLGWSSAAVSGAVCVEASDEGRLFTERLWQNTPLLAKYKANEIKALPLSCGHINQFLAAVVDACESECAALTEGGRLSQGKLSAGNRLLAAAFVEGIEWLFLKSNVERLYPKFCKLMQFAKNAVGQLQRQESEVQLLLKIRAVAFANATCGEQVVDWGAVAATVEKGSPGTKHNIQDLRIYYKKLGGSINSDILDDLSAFFANHVPSGRGVASATFAALAGLRLPPEKFMPYFATACVKAQATCPPS